MGCHFSEHKHWESSSSAWLDPRLQWSPSRATSGSVWAKGENEMRETGLTPFFFFISCLYPGWFMFNIPLGVASTYSINNTVILSWCPWMWYQYRALYLAMFLIWTIKAYERPLWLAAFCASHDVRGMKASVWYVYSIFTCLTDEVLILRTSDWFVGHSLVCGKRNNTIGDETIDAFREIRLWINTASSLITYYSNYIAKKEKYKIRGKCILMLSLYTECYSRCHFLWLLRRSWKLSAQ